MHFTSIPTAHGRAEPFLWRTCTWCLSSEVPYTASNTDTALLLRSKYQLCKWPGENDPFHKKGMFVCAVNSQVINCICLSGKGIGKALMSKVAQVSKSSICNLILTVKKWKCTLNLGPFFLSLYKGSLCHCIFFAQYVLVHTLVGMSISYVSMAVLISFLLNFAVP